MAIVLSKAIDIYTKDRTILEKEKSIVRLFQRFVASNRDYNSLLKSSVEYESIKPCLDKYLSTVDYNERLDHAIALNAFFEEYWDKYCVKETKPEIFYDKKNLFEKTERTILLLKMLQGGEHPKKRYTQKEIAEKLNVSETTVKNYEAELRTKQNLLGSNIQINLKSGNVYDSTVHPIFLALNLTEVYMLTVMLEKIFDLDSPYHERADNIASDVYRQLSDYAKEIIDKRAEESDVRFTGQEKGFRNDAGENKVLYYVKSGKRFKIKDQDNKEYIGQFKFYTETNQNFQSEDGTLHYIDIGNVILEEI